MLDSLRQMVAAIHDYNDRHNYLRVFRWVRRTSESALI